MGAQARRLAHDYADDVYARRLVIDDFKAFKSSTVHLQPMSLILGPNGTGKTSVLQAFELLTKVVESTIKTVLDQREWDYTDLSHLKTKTKQFGFEVALADGLSSNEDELLRWRIRLGHKRGPGVAAESVKLGDETLLSRSWREMSRFDRSTGAPERITQTLTQSWLSTVAVEDSDRFPELLKVAEWARQVAGYIELQPTELRTASRRTDEGIGRDGGKLAGFLAFLESKHPEQFEAAIDAVRSVYPRLVAIELKSARAGWVRLTVTERWGKKELTFNAQQVSDGLLRLLAIAALAWSPIPPSLVMFDEIENGLHPHLLEAVIGLLQSVADNGTQVIATTHSPVALNYVKSAEQVLIASRDRTTGEATLTPMNRSRAYKRVQAVMDPGEAWFNLGEERLLAKVDS